MDVIYISGKNKLSSDGILNFYKTATLNISSNYLSDDLRLTAPESGENFCTLTPDLNLARMNDTVSQLRSIKKIKLIFTQSGCDVLVSFGIDTNPNMGGKQIGQLLLYLWLHCNME